MPDLLVRLYDLPPCDDALATAHANGVEIRRALAPEKHLVIGWAAEHFSQAWASECEVAFARLPLSCFLATKDGRLCGFVAYEATCRNFLGPLGVAPEWQGKGVGAALLVSALHAMRSEGYAYAIIGGAGPVAFFQRTVGAVVIEGSEPGVYRGMLRASWSVGAS